MEENVVLSNLANLPISFNNQHSGVINIGGKKFQIVDYDPGIEYMLGQNGERIPVPGHIKERISQGLSGMKSKLPRSGQSNNLVIRHPGKENHQLNL